MATVFKSVIVALLGIVLGLLATWLSIDKGRGFGAVRAGPWTGWPKAGTAAADPYSRAAMSRTGEIPLSLAEGLSFIARTDSDGNVLRKDCVYSIKPPVPVSRFWTLTVTNPDGTIPGVSGDRNGLTSSEIFRTGAGNFSISLAANIQPGNWLPINTPGLFFLVLRLYDTPVSAAASALSARDLPKIERGACS